MATVLIIDDDAGLRAGIAETLADLGHIAEQAHDGETGLARLARGGVDAVLLDLRMPGLEGMEVLRRLRATAGDRAPPVAVLTAVPTAANTIEAMRLGAVDHLPKPIGRNDLVALIARMLPSPGLAAATAAERTADESDLVGSSAAMRSVQKSIGMLADRDATVLVTGETGTGKEVVAQAIHRHGRRAAHPFVAVNCAAIPAGLLESQLFGHARGAFTGAMADRIGSFREANGGTLFLDEIGDMDLTMQAKLLRVVQERVVTPVGGRPVPIDVRIIAATHRDLQLAVRDGGFREDLYYRLGVVPLHLPPLRDRLADIVPLAEHFLALAAGKAAPRGLSAAAAARLLAHPWPGNVRELRNAMERAATLARRPVIEASDLEFLHAGPVEAEDWLDGTLPAAVARLEAAMIRRALANARGNRTEAAGLLGIHRQLLYEKLKRFGLDELEIRTDPVGKPDASMSASGRKTRIING